MYTGASAMAMMPNFQRSQDTLWTLAADTGGKSLLNSNDLAAGIVQAQQATSSYYILCSYATNQALDGKFRRIRVTLNKWMSAALDFRQGYYAGKQFATFTVADKEGQLEEALMLGDPITELTIAMEIDYFQLNRAEYFVPLIVKIPGRENEARERECGHSFSLSSCGFPRSFNGLYRKTGSKCEFSSLSIQEGNMRQRMEIRIVDPQ
jgi:hypothetical protein